jgi:hypothetical protein
LPAITEPNPSTMNEKLGNRAAAAASAGTLASIWIADAQGARIAVPPQNSARKTAETASAVRRMSRG